MNIPIGKVVHAITLNVITASQIYLQFYILLTVCPKILDFQLVTLP